LPWERGALRVKNQRHSTGSDSMSDIFLSYSSKDRQWAKLLADCLQKEGWSVWWDRTIPTGQIYAKVIKEALSNARSVVVIWSHESVDSDWVQEEAAKGRDRGILVPVFKENAEPPMGFGMIQAADLSDWDSNLESEQFKKLIQDLTSILGPPKTEASRTEVTAPPPVEPKPVEPQKLKTPELKRRNRTILIGVPAGLALLLLMVGLGFLVEPPEKTITNNLGMKFVLISPGTFEMGSPAGEPGRHDDERQHRVTISKPFYLQTTEVTQGQWQKVTGENPSYFNKCGKDCPVEMVSWNDAQGFIAKLNKMEKTDKYRLPTETEWEFACRAGSTTSYFFGDKEANLKDYAWYDDNSQRKTHPVGQKKPNALGLYDLHGNVFEWVQDWHGEYLAGPVTDPQGPASGTYRVIRGGGWRNPATITRSAGRGFGDPVKPVNDVGFRVAKGLSPLSLWRFWLRSVLPGVRD
jgi:formylglycine-generating enzyme required for sulfatase activity